MYSLKEHEKKQMIDEIAYFFKEEHNLDLGIIGTENIFDFFLKMMGDHIYNIALNDAKKFFQQYVENMDTDYYALYKE